MPLTLGTSPSTGDTIRFTQELSEFLDIPYGIAASVRVSLENEVWDMHHTAFAFKILSVRRKRWESGEMLIFLYNKDDLIILKNNLTHSMYYASGEFSTRIRP